ncbi:MAG: MurR/RpiR family transcriptional regulator [Clostridia bacterium]|nr:MurR/RpiR family transcriptional regulator [Clostridia bacterium]
MESIMHKIRFMQEEMGRSEKRIADYILKNPESIINMSITELADSCRSGDATVVRFARRLGFSGYQALKLGIASEISSTSAIDNTIQKSDSCYEIFQKRIKDISLSLKYTESVLDTHQLDLAAKAIMNAGRVVIYGLGNSAPVAMDAAHKFLRIGIDAQACCDNHMQAIIASHVDENTVVIGISHSGSSKDIVDALTIAKERGAKTICITNYGNSTILHVSDIKLYTQSEETKRSILAMSSRIAQLTIFDAIYTYIVVNSNKKAMNAIYGTETALKNKKY